MNSRLCISLTAVLLTPGVHFAQTTNSPAPATTSAKLVIHADQGTNTISRNIYGQFTEHLGHCIYGGIWVGEGAGAAPSASGRGAENLLTAHPDKTESKAAQIPNTRGIRNDVVAALRKIKVPVVRWPGGCFADEYHWRDGIGPRDQRPAMINTHWGGVVENNHFGTHEFMDFCEQIGAEPCICGNVGSGTVQEMMEWVEYITSDADSPLANLRRRNGRDKPWKLPYFAVGNENWGCGGNMRPEFYADNFRRYNTFIKNYPGNKVYRVACGASDFDYHWTEVLMSQVRHGMDGLSLHYYTIPSGNWGHKGSATQFTEEQWQATMQRASRMEELVTKHSEVMDKQDPQKRIGLIVDEWGVWHDVEPGTNPGFLFQQNTMRDALVAGTTLNIFNNHCDRVKMANIAQMINVLQSMILTDNEKMLLTPTYHVFEMYTVHQDATLLPTDLQSPVYEFGADRIPALNVSASRDPAGKVHLTLCNVNPNAATEVACEVQGAKVTRLAGRILTAPDMAAHNTFDRPHAIKPEAFAGFSLGEHGFAATLPPKSVVVLELN